MNDRVWTRALATGLVLVATALSGGCDEAPAPLWWDTGARVEQGVVIPDGAVAGDRGAAADRGRPDTSRPPDAAPPKPDAPDKPWVKITSPQDNATVANPVTFKIAAHKVATVQLWAENNFALSSKFDPKTKSTVTYTYSYTNYKRKVTLKGYDSGGKELASHSVSFSFSN